MKKSIFILFIVLTFFSCKKFESIPHGGNTGKYKFDIKVVDKTTKEPIYQAKVTIKRDGKGNTEQQLTDHLGQVRFPYDKKVGNGKEMTVSVEATGYNTKAQKLVVDKKEGYDDKQFIIDLEEEE